MYDVPRDKGRYSKHPACDCCGRPCLDYGTDDRICGGGDGPGFYLCSRVHCGAKREKIEADGGVEALRAHYTTQRDKNTTRRLELDKPSSIK